MRFRENVRLDPSQVQDRRGMGGLGRGVAIGGGGLGTLLLLAIALLFGVNPFEGGSYGPAAGYRSSYEGGQAAGSLASECQTGADANERQDCRTLGFVNSIQAFWDDEFARHGASYAPSQTVLFSNYTDTGCGTASSQVGPFYCPNDDHVYVDLDFLNVLLQRLGAKNGPLAQAYVIAHEYGHHVQDLVGTLDNARRGDSGPRSGAVLVELQADCFAGVWVRHAAATGYLEPPQRQDINDALSAAAAVGDDRIQKATQGQVNPEKWTHGSAEQRQGAFLRGYESGDMMVCDQV